MTENNSLVFRIRLTKEEVQTYLIQILKMENLINGGNEEKYLTDMTFKNKHVIFEFVVPKNDVKTLPE